MMAKHLSWLNPSTCGCQVVSWFDDALDAKVDDVQHLPERSGEIHSGSRLAVALAVGATTITLDETPKRAILVDDIIMIPREFMLVTAVPTPTTLTVVRGQEDSPQGQRKSHPTIDHQFIYVAHPVRSNVFVRRGCDVHAAVTDGKILYTTVLEENNRKNVAVGMIGTLATVDREEVWAVIDKPDAGDGKGGWRYDTTTPRNLTFNFAALLQQTEIDAMQAAADIQFGPGLVTLERQ